MFFLKNAASKSHSALPFSVGDIIEVSIDDLAFGGEGVGHFEGVVIFIPFVALGERVEIEIVEAKKNFGRGRLIRIIEASPDRVKAPCPYFTNCGGCQYQHLHYEVQLAAKHKQLIDLFERLAGFHNPPIQRIFPSPEPFGYRNRILVRTQYSRITRRMSVGFLRHDNRLVVDVEHCRLAENSINEQLQRVRENPPNRNGVKFNLRLMPEDWVLPRDSFFQINRHLLSEMSATVRHFLQKAQPQFLLDIYCGVGFFCIECADLVRRFVGIEIDKRAIDAARENAKKRRRENGTFIESSAEMAIEKLIAKYDPRRMSVILDPPRRGCAASLIEVLRRHLPRQIIYISCHPATLCRDLKALCRDDIYRLASVKPIDMFPQTKHIESLCEIVANP